MYAFTLKVPLRERAPETSVPGTTGELRAAKRFDARQFRALIGVLESRRPGSLRRRASPRLSSPSRVVGSRDMQRRTTFRGEDYRFRRALSRNARRRATRALPRSRVSSPFACLDPPTPSAAITPPPLGPVHSRRVKVASARCGWRPCQTITATVPHPLAVGP